MATTEVASQADNYASVREVTGALCVALNKAGLIYGEWRNPESGVRATVTFDAHWRTDGITGLQSTKVGMIEIEIPETGQIFRAMITEASAVKRPVAELPGDAS